MPRMCDVCGKKTQFGNKIERRGMAKYLGGVGQKITGKTRRRFEPNLQSVRVRVGSGGVKRMRVCTRCLRSGRVVKAA
ncbi:MAG: 50S ribosomal protein L28 [Planctomycetes bacterium]|nr:50S ribosomal protein L28 [Planctomycetota bacterium]MBM4078261.1 50S ribosomal protein L28 [Planctomycetota bacterium]MBM4085101.1 50S ribosomal protein L28 [Planctomycetota bacterium]